MPATASIRARSIQAESLSAATDRLVNTVLLNEGVVNMAGNSFKVNQDTGANMAVKIGSGAAFDRAAVQGDVAGMGVFVVEHNNAAQTLAVAASHATNPRIDIVVLRVYDNTFDSSGNSWADIEVIQGTPAGSPVAPAVPASAIKLANVAVAAGATAIVNANITDTRVEATIPQNPRLSGPLGVLGYAVLGADVNITAGAQILGVTVSVLANRRIKITAVAVVNSTVAGDDVNIRIRSGVTTVGGEYGSEEIRYASGTAPVVVNRQFIDTTVAADAAKNYNLWGTRLVGTGTVNAITAGPTYILVEDIGPA